MGDEADIGSPIDAAEFRRLVEQHLARMEAGSDMSTDDYVIMTRLFNTIAFGQLVQRDEIFRRYHAAFFPRYVAPIQQALDATPTKGMALYAKDHDLYLGGKPHANSMYRITEAPRRD
jgi:hypothetical protein